LSLLTAGQVGDDPMKTLASEGMRALVDEARGQFDWVILDTVPVGPVPDAVLLASVVDAVLLVASAGATCYDALQRAADALDPSRILGVVLNNVEESHSEYDYASYPTMGSSFT
jgi:Mrp family chromosome partitioning ATPase